MNTGKKIAYVNEPKNYNDLRVKIENLMRTVNQVKKDFNEISNIDLIQEQFQERTREAKGQLSQMIYLLGEVYGYSLSDDILENVEL